MIPKKRKKKKSFREIFTPILFGLIFLAFIVFLGVSSFKISQRRNILISQIEILQKEIQILEEKNKNLKSEISQSQSESFLEKEARERLGLKKPGEEVVAIKKIEGEEPEKIEEEKSFWQKVLEFFKF